MERDRIRQKIVELVAEFGELDPAAIDEETRLIGSEAVLKSRALVELLLALEDLAEAELDASFDWTSDSALSEARSLFRNVGSLTDHLDGLARP